MAGSLTDRMLGAATLNVATYEEVEADESATGQAAAVVILVSIAAAIGSVGNGANGVVSALVANLVGWALLAGVVYLVGTRVFGGTATWGEVLRTMGFAQAPGVLYALGFIPLVGGLVSLAVWIWILVTTIVAIRQALDVDTTKAIATGVIGWLVMLLPKFLLAIVVGAALLLGR